MIRVLLIEDNPDDAELCKVHLADSDFSVFNTATAKEALDFLGSSEAGVVDVVLLDLSLPNGEGVELVDRVLAKARESSVVLLTGTNDENVVAQSIAHGVAGFVSKHGMTRLSLLTQMQLAVKSRKVPAKHRNTDTLSLLAKKIELMKVKGDEVISELEKVLDDKPEDSKRGNG